jgi:hypothetical protein
MIWIHRKRLVGRRWRARVTERALGARDRRVSSASRCAWLSLDDGDRGRRAAGPARARDAAEFSFLLGVPTLGAACAYKLLQNLVESSRSGAPNLFEVLGVGPIAIGFAVAAVSACSRCAGWRLPRTARARALRLVRIALSAVLGSLLWAGVVTLS